MNNSYRVKKRMLFINNNNRNNRDSNRLRNNNWVCRFNRNLINWKFKNNENLRRILISGKKIMRNSNGICKRNMKVNDNLS